MVFANPSDHAIANSDRELAHLRRILVGHCAGTFVSGDVAFLSEGVEGPQKLRVRTNCFAQRLDDSVMMLVPRRSIAGCGECSCRRLQRGVISDVHPPVGAYIFRGAVGQITIDDGQQIGDFASAGSVWR